MAHVMRAAIFDAGAFKASFQAFLISMRAKGGLTGKNKRLCGIAHLIKSFKLIDDGVGKGNTPGVRFWFP